MVALAETGIDIFSGQLPSKEELYKLYNVVNSSQANRAHFAEQAQQASQSGNTLAAGIAFSIIGEDKAAVENLERASDCVEKSMYLAWSLRRMGEYDNALKNIEKAAKSSDASEIVMEKIAILRDAKKFQEAQEIIDGLANLEKVSADYHYEKARLLERLGQYQDAIDNYETALELESEHTRVLFHLAFACDLWGDEEAAIDYYNQLIKIQPVSVSALLNLAVLYEDREKYEKALNCIELVLKHHPSHPKASLFRKDIRSSMNMFFDEEKEKRIGKHNQILEIPISDFELSVRSRNCLRKMNIRTLGDLAAISESELLSYKNFGETSLKEIRVIMEMKGLKLGSTLDDKKMSDESDDMSEYDNEMYAKAVTDLELSVRAKKALERLGVRTLGELCRRTEAELLGCKNFGVTSLNEIKQALTTLGIGLRKLG